MGEAQKTQAVYTEGAKATGGATCCSKLVHLQGGPTRGSRHLGASGFTGGVMKKPRPHRGAPSARGASFSKKPTPGRWGRRPKCNFLSQRKQTKPTARSRHPERG